MYSHINITLESNPGRVVYGLVLGLVEGYVEFVAVVSPRDEDEIAFLLIEREMSYVERAVSLDDRREHPQHLSVWRHDRIRVHTVAETVVHAAITVPNISQKSSYSLLSFLSFIFAQTRNQKFTAGGRVTTGEPIY